MLKDMILGLLAPAGLIERSWIPFYLFLGVSTLFVVS